MFSKILVATGYWRGYTPNTEIVDLSSNCSASLPDYPKEVRGTTGQFLNDSAIICGGEHDDNEGRYSNECYSLEKGANHFETITPMKAARGYAKSIVTQGKMWVTGGYEDDDFYGRRLLASTDFIPKSSFGEPNLPEPIAKHALVSINETTTMLIGGERISTYFSPKTHYFNHEDLLWTNGPSLMTGRYSHTAGLITDHVTQEQHVAVVGGWDSQKPVVSEDSVELLLSGETQWTKGILIFSISNAHHT